MKKYLEYPYYLSKRILNYLLFDKFLNYKNISNINNICKGNEILILILHCEKYKDRVNYIKEYYSNFLSADFIFYSDYEDIENHVLKVSFSKEYYSAELKHVNILNLISQSGIYQKYKFVFCVDDDTFINMNKVFEVCTKLQSEIVDKFWVCGQILNKENNIDNPAFKKWPCLQFVSGGAGYLINSNVFKHITKFKMPFAKSSDLALGLILLNYPDIKLHDNKMFHGQKHNYYNIDEADIKNNLTFHYIKNKEEFEFYINCSAIK